MAPDQPPALAVKGQFAFCASVAAAASAQRALSSVVRRLHLQRDMADVEMRVQRLTSLLQHGVAVGALGVEHDVGAQGGLRCAHRPDMQVMHIGDAAQAEQAPATHARMTGIESDIAATGIPEDDSDLGWLAEGGAG